MLQESADEFPARHAPLPGTVRTSRRVTKCDVRVVDTFDAVVTDRHAVNVRSQILQHGASVTHGLGIHVPTARSCLRIDREKFVFDSGRTHRITKLRAEHNRGRFFRKQKIVRTRLPR